MERNFFRNMPIEITTDILSRLPIRSIALSKCVCKRWLNLIDSDDFEFKTPPALVLLQQMDSTRCSIFDIEDEDEDDLEIHDLHYIPLTHFDIPHENSEPLAAMAANGLLLLYSKLGFAEIPLFICNPITRQYIEIWGPEECILDVVVVDDDDDYDDVDPVFCFGFGVSEISGQYKVVCINADTDTHYVYTLGTGTWKRVQAGAASGLGIYSAAHIVCNGNLHWTGVYYSPHTIRICGFDLENECFSVFSAPPPPPPVNGHTCLTGELSALRDCLCYSYTWEEEIVIWLMKEYQVEESWTMLYKISNNGFDFDRASGFGWNYMCVKPIKLFKDGDVLMMLDEKRLIYYSNKTRIVQQVDMFKDAAAKDYVSTLVFTPSLFSLKNFRFKNVFSF
ncbi:F-box protein CPR1-like [Salvia splendens]|uniref:F-box protein CPR1-like n=1 Tax=Salvia splendens TaxID=180675 RepID=UPI001C2742CB|nr:F-box protein CPR1-like [Salvia splendens]